MRPVIAMAVGATAVSATSIFIKLAGSSPGTASFYRCILALPFLLLIAVREASGSRLLARRELLVAVLAGVLFAGDMIFWTQAIYDVGAGISTVLVNVQVIFVPLLALAIDHEPISRRFLMTLPFAAIGVVLAGGLIDHGIRGGHTLAGTADAVAAALCYSGFLFILRRSGKAAPVVQSYAAVIAASALASAIGGALWQGLTIAPPLAAIGWLTLAGVCGQVIGWLLVARASPDLDSQTSSVLLLLTPIGSLVLAALILAQHPSPLQWAGSLVILICAFLVAQRPRVHTAEGSAFQPRRDPATPRERLRPHHS